MTKIVAPHNYSSFRLPTNDEYHKVTYYKGGSLNALYYTYPTQSNTAPKSSSTLPADPHVANYGLYWTWLYGKNELQLIGKYPKATGFYGTLDDASNVAQWTGTNDDTETMLMVRGADWDYWDHQTGTFEPTHYLLSSTFRTQLPSFSDEHIGFRMVKVAPRFNPDTPEFRTVVAAYIEANNKYHLANDEYIAAYEPYKKMQDKYLPLSTKLDSAAEQLLAAYKTYGRESNMFIKANASYDAAEKPMNIIWGPHLQAISDMQEAEKKRDTSEKEYLAAQAQYLTSSAQMGHKEDPYDQDINQYNEAIKEYIAVAYPFFAIEAEWDQTMAQYALDNKIVATGQNINPPIKIDDEDTYLARSKAKLQQNQSEHEPMLQNFLTAQEKHNDY